MRICRASEVGLEVGEYFSGDEAFEAMEGVFLGEAFGGSPGQAEEGPSPLRPAAGGGEVEVAENVCATISSHSCRAHIRWRIEVERIGVRFDINTDEIGSGHE